MKDEEYTNREISSMFKNIEEKLDMHIDSSQKMHGEILGEVKYTNGKVGELVKWRERVNGGAIVCSIFFSVIVIPVTSWLIYSFIHIPETIKESVQEAVKVYEVPSKN